MLSRHRPLRSRPGPAGAHADDARHLRGLRRDWADLPERVSPDLEAGRGGEALRALHSLKGIAGNLGAVELQERAKTAAARAKAGALRAVDAVDELRGSVPQEEGNHDRP